MSHGIRSIALSERTVYMSKIVTVMGMLERIDRDIEDDHLDDMEFWDRLNRAMFSIQELRKSFESFDDAALADGNSLMLESMPV